MSTNIFQFWRAVEALTPQELIRLDSQNKSSPVYSVASGADGLMPWSNAAHCRKVISSGFAWRYLAQCGVYSTDALTDLVLLAIGKEEGAWHERSAGMARLYDLTFDAAGFPVAHSFALSLAAWSAGQILLDEGRVDFLQTGGKSDLAGLSCPDASIPLVNSGLSAFDDLSRMLAQWVADESQEMRAKNQPANSDWLQSFTHLVARHCAFPLDILDGRSLCRVKAVLAKNEIQQTADDGEGAQHAKNESVDILSSFYVEDLKRISKAWGAASVGKGLSQFMGAVTGKRKAERLDVREAGSTSAIHDALRPERIPMGRWPSDHALVFSQQLAVNEAWRTLENNAGLFSVNGPPGTGKTTLLRDVVAAVVTNRAAALIRTRNGNLGAKNSFKLGSVWVPYYPLHASLHGHSIVIATSNNGAAENVTLELPGIAAVPNRIAQRTDYFTDIARSVTGKDAWALIAAPLGNRKNRAEFLTKFWWGDRAPKDLGPTTPLTGLRGHLKAIIQGTAPALDWDETVKQYKSAVAREQHLRGELSIKAKLPEQITGLRTRLASDNTTLLSAQRSASDRQDSLGQYNARIQALKHAVQHAQNGIEDAQRRVSEQQKNKPRFLLWISTLGRAQRQWTGHLQVLKQQVEIARSQCEMQQAALKSQRHERDMHIVTMVDLDKRLASLQLQRQQTIDSLQASERQLHAAKETLGTAWPKESANLDERERIEPWAQNDWLQAREDLFLASLAVHRAFVENHPTEMLANLNLASDWLSGKAMPPELARTALDSLCLVVPVISTTFASVPRMFANMVQESIGWLLIDEAGQALPHHAAGAIWRAKRTIVVGDPRQLEPVCSMPTAIEAKLASIYNVDAHWWPSHTSAQSVADQSSRLGTLLTDDSGQQTWVGAPLRLHRRCDEPMFSISNQVAYAGMMVQGKKGAADVSLPSSRWFDVRADLGEGHWVPDEGQQAEAILNSLVKVHGVDRGQIALLSPFRDCAKKLKALSAAYGLNDGKVGTVHTAQGKEADVLVLVLGGNPNSPGAKSWAAEKPNLVNVAVSRAKKRLYVVGNREQWAQQKHFATLADLLPVQ